VVLLADWMLKPPMRQFVIDVVKAPLEKAIILAASFLPEPVREECSGRVTQTAPRRSYSELHGKSLSSYTTTTPSTDTGLTG